MAVRDDDLINQLIAGAKDAPDKAPAPAAPARPRASGGAAFGAAAGKLATWAVTLTFGGIIWAVNGGYSVTGLERIAGLFNIWGAFFWRAMARWEITLLDMPLPVLPWVLVTGATVLQIIAMLGRLRRWRLPGVIYVAAVAVSFYDLGTTHAGLLGEDWLAGVPWPVVLLFATVLTVAFELIVSLLLRD